jgi:protocatechuate 3,4-dioxygenase beta subunit
MQSTNYQSVHFLRGRQTTDSNGLVTFTRIGPPVYTVDQMNNLLDQMNENHQAEKAELLAEIQRLRAELHAEVDAVKTTVNTEAYLNSGD